MRRSRPLSPTARTSRSRVKLPILCRILRTAEVRRTSSSQEGASRFFDTGRHTHSRTPPVRAGRISKANASGFACSQPRQRFSGWASPILRAVRRAVEAERNPPGECAGLRRRGRRRSVRRLVVETGQLRKICFLHVRMKSQRTGFDLQYFPSEFGDINDALSSTRSRIGQPLNCIKRAIERQRLARRNWAGSMRASRISTQVDLHAFADVICQ